MAADVPRALELVERVPFDLVLLDIDLRGEHVEPVATAARRRGKPVIFISGYGEAYPLPAHLRSCRVSRSRSSRIGSAPPSTRRSRLTPAG